MNKKNISLFNRLLKARTEEAVKAAIVRHFDLEVNTEHRIDLFVPPVLFETKYDLNLAEKSPVVLAQALYYVRHIRDTSAAALPTWIALIDKNEGALVKAADWQGVWDNDETDFDWNRAPSNPCPKLVQAISESQDPIRVFDFNNELDEFLGSLGAALKDETTITRPITEDNFEAVFRAWEVALGLEGQEMAPLFVADCCMNVWFDDTTGELAAKRDKGRAQVPVKAYKDFWSAYRRPPTVEAQREIKSRRDRLRAIQTRRVEGEFFTPPLFCEKARDYLTDALGENWQDEYVVWDPAMGTANLLWPLRVPGERMFGSTLRKEDAESVDWYDGATIFQFDFLNDPVEKLPDNLRAALEQDKVLILMNPPYAEATSGGTTTEHKTGVKDTQVAEDMPELGRASNELFVQFFWRCRQLCQHASIAMFATLKYINAPAFTKFRDQVLEHYRFDGGFIFPSKVFDGTAGSWPVSFGIWNILGGE